MNIRQFSERTRVSIEFGGGAFIAIWIALLFLLGFFTIPELLTYDWRFYLRGERPPLDDILIITIDEESERRLQQRMPWKRSVHAEMIRTLMQHDPALIVYDVIFQSATDPEEDARLADALYDAYDEEREMGLVILAQYLSPQRLERPLDLFADNAGGIGFINLYPDRDNIIRSVPTVTRTLDDDTIQHHLCLSLE
ncbi:CHASE2 domain-containing protein, partial [candidate division KSB3 bacterium]|nr:CHASE2 domain-containing protein [candidate division KSB3 bacterium]MBD3325572.1 CHASE2 domain-containing protein [candidate division KSB3 bacterium]